MDDYKNLPTLSRHADPPAVRQTSTPALPSSAGGIAFSRRQRQEMDARFNRALADNLRAQADACKAAGEYSDARFDLAVTMARWNTLPDVIAHFERKGYMERDNELAVLAVELETRLINALSVRDQAVLARQAYQPQPSAPPPVATMPSSAPQPIPAGLDPRDVEAVLQRFPDVKPESIEPIVLMLRAVLAEKRA